MIRRLPPLAALLAVAALALAPAGAQATAPLGGLTALASPFGCVLPSATAACGAGTDVDTVADVAASPSANVLYVMSNTIDPLLDYTLSAYRLDPATGHLGARIGCVQYIVISAGCSGSGAVYGGGKLAVGPDGRGLYVAIFDGGNGGVASFGTDPSSGAIGALQSCIMQNGLTCTPGDPSFAGTLQGHALNVPHDIAVSPDGRTVYVASGGNKGGLAALARNTGTGALTAELNCLTGVSGPSGDTGCTFDAGVQDASSVAASNLAVYVGSDHSSSDHGSVVAYARDSAAGTIQARIGCLQQSGGGLSSCLTALGGGLVGPGRMIIAPGAGTLYVASINSSAAYGELASIHLTASGVPSSPLAGCLMSSGGADACSLAPAVRGDGALAIGGDGRHLYVADDLANQIAAFTIDPATGAALVPALSCVARSAIAGCPSPSNAAAMSTLDGLAIGRGGSVLYAGSHGGGLALLGIEAPPACAALTATTTAGTPVAIPLACSDPNGDALTSSIAAPPAHGTLGAVSAGAVTYTPAAGFTGVDSFGYAASDGTASAPAASVAIAVTAAPGGGGPIFGGPATGLVLSHVALSPKAFRAASKGATLAAARRRAKRPPVGATLSWRLSAAATLTLTVQHRTTGRRSGRRCVAATRSNRRAKACTLWVALEGHATHASKAGAQHVRFSGRWGRKALAPGAYRLGVVATDAARRRSRSATAGFAIAR